VGFNLETITVLVVALLIATVRPLFIMGFLVATSFIHPESRLASLAFPEREIVLLAAVAVILTFLRNPSPIAVRRAAIASAPLIIVVLRMFFAGGDPQMGLALLCVLFAVGGALAPAADRRTLNHELALLGLAFAIASTFLGSVSRANFDRIAGVSGNPNLMIFALLSFAPFVFLNRSRTALPVSLVYATFTIGLVLRSGSAQAIPGLIVLAAAVGVTYWQSGQTRGPTRMRNVVAALVFLFVGSFAVQRALQVLGPKFSATHADLSGRTELFHVAWNQFLSSPWVGTGSLRVLTSSTGLDRSAHNAYLALLSAAGLLILVPLAILVVTLIRSLPGLLKRGDPVVAVLCVMATIALVQGIELQIWTWFFVGYAVAPVREAASARRVEESRPPAVYAAR
jgi:O-antigen ligase